MEKTEKRPGYFARLKKKRQLKQSQSEKADAEQSQSDLESKTPVICEPAPIGRSQERNAERGQPDGSDEISKSRSQTKKERSKPPGTAEFTVGAKDTLNSIALKFNITPNKLVQLNRLYSLSVVPGQKLFVPEVEQSERSSEHLTALELKDSESSCRSRRPVRRETSPLSEDESPVTVKFLKMSCKYFTDGMGVVGGVMIITPNNIMFDPHKSDPLVIENGCEEYGLICPMEEVLSVALYDDVSRMKLKDALPSPGEWEELPSERDLNPFSRYEALGAPNRPIVLDDIETAVSEISECQIADKSPFTISTLMMMMMAAVIRCSDEPQDLCPLYRPGEWEELPSERDLNPFSRYEALGAPNRPIVLDDIETAVSEISECQIADKSPSDEGFTELELLQSDSNTTCSGQEGAPLQEQRKTPTDQSVTSYRAEEDEDEGLHNRSTDDNAELLQSFPNRLDALVHDGKEATTEVNEETKTRGETLVNGVSAIEATASDQKTKATLEDSGRCSSSPGPNLEDNKGPNSFSEAERRRRASEAEMKSWLLKRMQRPIEDMLLSKEEKSKSPPMFLCFKVGKPMRKSFAAGRTSSPAHSYVGRGRQPEYWFAVPQERVDHLYSFFIQWSPDTYGKDAQEQGFVVVEKDELTMIDNFYSDPVPRSWEIITINEAKRRQSFSFEDEEPLDLLPVLMDPSALLEDTHIEKVYRWKGENSYFVKGCTGHLGLWLNADLYHGTTSKCSTFNNLPLSSKQDFTIQNLEVWAFE
ncbi:nuclear receptor coactivator 7-like [Sinocyclocheilus grahami]|uniref:nuclear receptor coactivator 7-like n=1 Tax=Sinocyclocheilus grahami TaxID=75366 RepID=UPI0007AC74E9|nr:PREDICTED: nuclear receptor coactivator 7-like [Sinocyclocheilus grahami]